MSDITYRMATPTDAELFAAWCTNNPDIPSEDIEAAMTENVETFAFERDGKILGFLPFYVLIRIAFINFNPDLSVKDKSRVLKAMFKALTEHALSRGIHEINTLSKDAYAIAKWAKKRKFNADPRQSFSLKLTKKVT